VAEWFKAAVLKTARGRKVPRGFESHPFRHLRSDALAERRRLMKAWADYCEQKLADSNVVPIATRRTPRRIDAAFLLIEAIPHSGPPGCYKQPSDLGTTANQPRQCLAPTRSANRAHVNTWPRVQSGPEHDSQ
jgi:hypothetical protein